MGMKAEITDERIAEIRKELMESIPEYSTYFGSALEIIKIIDRLRRAEEERDAWRSAFIQSEGEGWAQSCYEDEHERRQIAAERREHE